MKPPRGFFRATRYTSFTDFETGSAVTQWSCQRDENTHWITEIYALNNWLHSARATVRFIIQAVPE